MSSADRKLIEAGIRVGDLKMSEEDKIWSRYSNDKVDIGEQLAKVVRTLNKALPLSKPLRALSVGSSAEPQFRILQTAFGGGLYLLDLEEHALDIVRERILRQHTDNVTAIHSDFNEILLSAANTGEFLRHELDGQKVNLVTLHHSLYYAQADKWRPIFENLWRKVLAPKSAVHAVLMAAQSDDPFTTTWLYNHFAGKFFGCRNDQDLHEFKDELERRPLFRSAQILVRTHRVAFNVDDFVKFMAIIWMILLYPNVHKYALRQREEITEFVFKTFWRQRRPLVQMQDHLVVYRGISFKGLV
ncbi:MAG: class I SAM-dependent methyltransferase [Planctomycetes bacterium]|nr:class I SAM-dependent methyltransferase [Planctomycetota bacterium]